MSLSNFEQYFSSLFQYDYNNFNVFCLYSFNMLFIDNWPIKLIVKNTYLQNYIISLIVKSRYTLEVK